MNNYTNLLVKFPANIDIKLNNSKYRDVDIEYFLCNKSIYFITLSNKNLRDIKFEEIRNKFIKELRSLNAYISVLYDSISMDRHEEISKSIYSLEREFRNLIEIVFLRKSGIDWVSLAVFEKQGKRDRKENRDEYVQALKNPLDDLDFKALNEFVARNITIDNNETLINKLDTISEKLDELNEKKFNETLNIERIFGDIEDLKNTFVTKKNKSLSSNELYMHLDPSINNEWNNLYVIRNLWAHNNCIITRKEYEEYNKISNIVFDKIRTEMTMIIFFNSCESEFSLIQEDNIKMKITKYKLNGVNICKFILVLTDSSESIIVEKEFFKYTDLIEIIKEFKIAEIGIYKYNPILLFNTEKIKEELKNFLKDTKLDDIKEIFNKLKNRNSNYSITKDDGDACILARNIDECLCSIFNN